MMAGPVLLNTPEAEGTFTLPQTQTQWKVKMRSLPAIEGGPAAVYIWLDPNAPGDLADVQLSLFDGTAVLWSDYQDNDLYIYRHTYSPPIEGFNRMIYVRIPTLDNQVVEGNEEFVVQVSFPAQLGASLELPVEIIDNDGPGQISWSATVAAADEGEDVVLSLTASQSVAFEYWIEDVSADRSADFGGQWGALRTGCRSLRRFRRGASTMPRCRSRRLKMACRKGPSRSRFTSAWRAARKPLCWKRTFWMGISRRCIRFGMRTTHSTSW